MCGAYGCLGMGGCGHTVVDMGVVDIGVCGGHGHVWWTGVCVIDMGVCGGHWTFVFVVDIGVCGGHGCGRRV